MRWLVDGYNVIRRAPELKSREQESLEAGRQALCALLAEVARASADTFTVVFDGAQSGGRSTVDVATNSPSWSKIEYSSPGAGPKSDRSLPAAGYPRYFSVEVNERVAQSLGIEPGRADDLARQLAGNVTEDSP
jgi:hypothetical protein